MNITTLLIIIAVVNTLNLIVTIFNSIQSKKRSAGKAPNLFEDQTVDPLITDLMEYAFDKGLQCSIRPGLDNKLTLYYHDEKDNNEYAITELHTTSSKKGSYSYNQILKELTTIVDVFLENKDIVKEKIKEDKNAPTDK